MRVRVNGEYREVAAGTTVADMVASVCESPAGIAVAMDREVVPRSSWSATVLRPEAHLEVVTAAAGG